MKKNIYIKIREALRPEQRRMALPQAGAAVLVRDQRGRILLLRKSNVGAWVVPGGVQDLNEDFTAVATRELREEVGLEIAPSDLKLVGIVAGRHNFYPNGDEVYNNTVLYALNYDENSPAIDISGQDYTEEAGQYVLRQESTEYGWFALDNLPEGFDDGDLVEYYKKSP